ncbi:MAG TPA: hypothetical protein VGY99_20970 [Candidatus Binataceae bacterium]|jgi:hypothetical protein|nr:hypothetical protein [Candidatus Binataceae bacterium]
MQRSKLAEINAARFASAPLVAECVFLNPAFLDGNIEREVCDLLLVLRDQALVVQMKSQDKPHSGEKLTRWIEKETRKAASQIKGTIRTLRDRPIWCNHVRRGQVEFHAGYLKPLQALVIVETQVSAAIPNDLPNVCTGIPISYLSLNDFLNLVNELRAFPEIALYLAQRAAFAESAQIPLGAERIVYAGYLANEGGFGEYPSYDEMAQSLVGLSVNELLHEKHAADRPAHVVENFVDSLAARIAHWDEGLTPDLTCRFDPTEGRSNYLRIQEEFCDLQLCDRRALGRQLSELRSMLDGAQLNEMAYASARSDNKPDMLYIVAASRGIARVELLRRADHLLAAGLAFYKKQLE